MIVDPSSHAANATTVRPPRMRTGAVSEFDNGAKLGTILDDTGRCYRFHAVEIVDGTRTIEVGSRVSFELLARFGAFEAARVTPMPS